MIPKKLHYCWFGKNKKPQYIIDCINSWKILGYEIFEWNEENYDLNKHEYLRKNYIEKKWAFVSDYVRLDVLYKNGGIYLDTDVKIKRKIPDDFLKIDFFLGFQFDCALGTHIIGAKKESLILKYILKEYNSFDTTKITNNIVFTDFFLKNILNFKLNGKNQILKFNNETLKIYSKEYFSCPMFFKKNYAVHLLDNSWRNKKYIFLKNIMKQILGEKIYYNLVAYKAMKTSSNIKRYKKFMKEKK